MQNSLMNDDKHIINIINKSHEHQSYNFQLLNKQCANSMAEFWPFIVHNSIIDEKIILNAMSTHLKLPIYQYNIEPQTVIPHMITLQDQIPSHSVFIPLQMTKNSCHIGVTSPASLYEAKKLQLPLQMQPSYFIIPIESAYDIYIKFLSSDLIDNASYSFKYMSQNIAELCNTILHICIHEGCSDIHGEPQENYSRIRYRVDGTLKTLVNLTPDIAKLITNRLKIMSHCDIAVSHLPQDGNLQITGAPTGRRDARINFSPTIHGEKWVIRLLQSNQKTIKLTDIGLSTKDTSLIKACIHQPQGLILVTGPTGSGKTTTLYAILAELNKTNVNIATIEDPVERPIAGVNQMMTNHATGLTFALGLKTLLRQDPDIIMVGEIRDEETAHIALTAAQTGHLVLATLHSNDSISTFTRLQSLNINISECANSLSCIVAQRLARKICLYCKQINYQTCPYCCDGYRGRCALYEILRLTKPMSNELLKPNLDLKKIESIALATGMVPLAKSGNNLVTNKITDQKEIERVLVH